MALSMLSRKPDSGLGNIKASPGSPSRNIDWILLLAQGALAIIGLFTIYSASYSKFSNPYLYVTRQEIFLIGAVISMIVVMSFDYDWWRERARFLYGVTIMLLVLVILVGAISGGARLSFDLGPLKVQPAEFAKFTRLAGSRRIPRRGPNRHLELRPVRQRPDPGRCADGAGHRPARPRDGVGADRDDDGCACWSPAPRRNTSC